MLKAFLNAWKIPELRAKLLFTLLMIVLYRVGSWLPVPYADVQALEGVRSTSGAAGAGLVSVINLFSGGALTAMAVFALGIMPYITASIIMQLLAVVIPKLEELQQEGEQGRQKITQYTRYITIVLAVLQSTGLVTLASNGTLFGTDVLGDISFAGIALVILTLTAGTAVIMWLGELITQRGVGNGMSLLIYVSIISQFPSQFALVKQQGDTQASAVVPGGGIGLLTVIGIVGLVITFAVVFMEQGQRRIPVQYARKQVGRRSYGGQSTYIPLKINQSGVIPVIFASSMLYLPTLAASITGWEPLVNFNARYLEQGITWVYIALFASMTIFFTYFYSAITFNPVEVADNMKRYGGFVPGIRPGTATAEYLDRVLTRITLPGSLYLTVVAIIPFIALAVFDIQAFPLGGVGLLIMVGVALQTMQQVESQLMQRNYEGFLT